MSNAPLVVEVLRGDAVESVHEVDAVVVSLDPSDKSLSILDAWGDAHRLVMPRSAIKPIQALPLVTSGAAHAFELGPIELALACASHNGEARHVEAVTAWLARVGRSPSDLECGPQWPVNQAARDHLITAAVDKGPEFNNCSGKHAGFLTVCAHLGLEPGGYIQPDHLLQAYWVTPAIEELCGVDVSSQTPGVDGCGIPVWTIPLASLASGWARLADRPEGHRLLNAMMAEPFYVAGTDRACTEYMMECSGSLAAKVGAEGVYAAVLPNGSPTTGSRSGGSGPVALALKVRDGAFRAAEVALAAILHRLGVMEPKAWPIDNHAGRRIGAMRAVL